VFDLAVLAFLLRAWRWRLRDRTVRSRASSVGVMSRSVVSMKEGVEDSEDVDVSRVIGRDVDMIWLAKCDGSGGVHCWRCG
jgi:hypothetical protein